MSIILHILDVAETLVPYKKIITETFDQTIAKITKILPVDQVDVVIRDESARTIPEIGLGGYAHGANFVTISLDSKRDDCRQQIVHSLPNTLAHELHHAKRFQTVGYGKGLLGAMIFEGLATHFEQEVTGIVPPYAAVLKEKELEIWMQRAKKDFYKVHYDYYTWFFGSKEKKTPRWTGYALGYKLVSDYLKKYPKMTAAQLHGKKAEAFIV